MATRLKVAALLLFVAFGTYLAFQSGIEPRPQSASNCAAARMLFCVMR